MVQLELTADPLAAMEEAPPYHSWTQPDGRLWSEFHRVADGFIVRFPDFADFFVSSTGDRVVCRALPATPAPDIEHLFHNQVRPLALGLTGCLVFHASAVEIGGHAVCFVGASGRGKSTLATSFGLAGHRVLTDDALIVDHTATGVMVRPSIPSIRLWADSGETLLGHQDGIAKCDLSYTSKWRISMGTKINHCEEALPMRRAYFLGSNEVDDVRITPLNGADVIRTWISHAFLIDVDDMSAMKCHFEDLSEFASGLECYALDYPRRYDCLVQVRAAVLRQCQQAGSPHVS